ncbi:MAG: peptidoglycan-binding protein LysM [Acidobacteriota bacterium]
MGLFDFVKSAGKGLFGGDDEPAAPVSGTSDDKAEEARRLLAQRKAAALQKEVADLGLGADNLAINVDGSRATVTGSAVTQADKEKIVLALGNVDGIDQVDDQLESNEAADSATFYTVESGDTLSGIAKKHYGNAGKYMVIFEANKPMLSDPNKIYPGQVLRIPPQD